MRSDPQALHASKNIASAAAEQQAAQVKATYYQELARLVMEGAIDHADIETPLADWALQRRDKEQAAADRWNEVLERYREAGRCGR